MRVRVLAFASARDALGAPERDFDLPTGSDLAALRRALIAHHPAFEEMWSRLAVAIDNELIEGEPALEDGQEVALLPPVSGGQSPLVALVDGPIAVADLVANVESPRRGAVVLFTGNVRDSHDDRRVERLTYEAHRPMALAALGRIVEEISNETTDLALAIHHRLGTVAAGEASVAIVAAAPHRAAAYEASRAALERLKREVPIWKREHYADGAAEWREAESLKQG